MAVSGMTHKAPACHQTGAVNDPLHEEAYYCAVVLTSVESGLSLVALRATTT